MKFVDVATRPEAGIEPLRRNGAAAARSEAQSMREHDALVRVAAAAAGASGLDDVLVLAAEEARSATGAASLSVSRWEEDNGAIRTLINVGELGPDEERFPADETYPIDAYPAVGEMIRSGRPYFNSLDDRDCDPQAVKVLTALGKSSDLGVPIVVEGETWGEVWASKGIGEPPFRAEDINFLEAIAGQFATAIARAELFSRVSRLAYEDALTGLPNRRAFDERLERALNRSRERGTPLAMLLCDLDGLKQINDGSGHEAGDRALRDAADVLVAAAADRPGAFVARIAGDEFCVLLEDRSLDDAIAIGAGAIAELSRSAAEHSLSCGAATATETTETPGDLLNAADRALYAAKRRGGSQVCIAKDGPAGSLARRQLRRSASLRDRIATASEALIADLDQRLASAPALDRLEAVASAYTEAADLASWTVSLATPGRDLLVDLSLGDNRDDEHQGVRVGPGTDKYRLSHYPATARIVAAGSGCFLAGKSDPQTDPSERELLVELGFESVLGVVAAAEDGVYLIELYGDRPGETLDELAAPLRLSARAAIPPPVPGRGGRSAAVRTGESQLSLQVARRLATAADVEDAAAVVAEELQRAFDSHVVHVVRLDHAMLALCAESGRAAKSRGWRQRWDAGLIGRSLRDDAPVLAGDVRREPQFRSSEGTRDVRTELAVPVHVGGRVWGALNLEDLPVDAFDAHDVRLVQAVAAQLGGALHRLELYASLERAYVGTAEALSTAIECKDPGTARHSSSIARRAVAVGRELGMDARELQYLHLGAAFHDIGKIAIPPELLEKPGPLTEEERAAIEPHTVIGERILAPIEFLKPVLPLVRHAHERWDGAGYPDGLAGEEIPFGARILFACDAHDAMSTDRPYRAALPEAEVRRELREGAGSQFDPTVIDALFAVLDRDFRPLI